MGRHELMPNPVLARAWRVTAYTNFALLVVLVLAVVVMSWIVRSELQNVTAQDDRDRAIALEADIGIVTRLCQRNNEQRIEINRTLSAELPIADCRRVVEEIVGVDPGAVSRVP